MSDRVIKTTAAAAAVLAGSLALTSLPAQAGLVEVKCYGIAKKAFNDCGANGHACAGQAAKDNDPNEWIYVPQGMCENFVVICADYAKKDPAEKKRVMKRACRRVADQPDGAVGGQLRE